MHWTWDDLMTLPIDVYEVLVDELVKEQTEQAHGR